MNKRPKLGRPYGSSNDNVRGHLLRMAISSLSELSDSSQHVIDWAYKHHTAEGRAEQQP